MMNEHTDIPLGQDFALELEQFHNETRARPAELATIRRRLKAVKPQRDRPPLYLLSLGIAGAMAAGSLVMLLPPEPIQQTLSAESWSEVQAHDNVLLAFSGQGDLHAKGRVHNIDWKNGRLKVSVTPKQGIDLTVRTPEARVAVIGTVFEVRRDTLGTTITVERGKVEVSCGEEPSLMLTAEQGSHTCMPVTAMGLLNRAQDLKTTDPVSALDAIESGLEKVDFTSPDFDDLHYRAAEIHYRAGRPRAALKSARASLSGGDATYTVEAHRLAAEQGWKLEGCEEATAHLTWLAEEDHATANEFGLLAQCTEDTDPAAAVKWLESAEAKTTDPGFKEMIRSKIDKLQP